MKKSNTVSLQEAINQLSEAEKKEVELEVQNYYMLLEVRKMRKELGLSQAELAAKARLPRTTITKIESGLYNPTLGTLMAIAHAVNKKLQLHFV